MLATAILVVNNLRDRVTDAAANKRTLAVRFGPRAARWEHTLAIATPFAAVSFGAIWGWIPAASAALTVLALPLAVREIRSVQMLDGPALNPHLGGAARLELVFGVLFSVGFFL